ncbi:MAG TPA: hypothetical protein VGD99_06345 [Anaerolineae bacterium]
MLMVIKANATLPAVTAQDVGRELYHHRQKFVQIIGDPGALKKIAWIFERVPDMFDIRFLNASLVVRCAEPKRTSQSTWPLKREQIQPSLAHLSTPMTSPPGC